MEEAWELGVHSRAGRRASGCSWLQGEVSLPRDPERGQLGRRAHFSRTRSPPHALGDLLNAVLEAGFTHTLWMAGSQLEDSDIWAQGSSWAQLWSNPAPSGSTPAATCGPSLRPQDPAPAAETLPHLHLPNSQLWTLILKRPRHC